MPQYKLTYFAIRGLAEPIRQIFHIGGIPYENVRVQFDEWAELKSKTPFGVLPILEVDGLQLSESNSIARYMAKEAGLYGKNNEEAALIDGIADLWTDYFNEIKPFRICLRTNDADEKEKAIKETLVPARDRFLRILTNFVKKNPAGFLVGDNLSFADLIIAEHLYSFDRLVPGYAKDYPELLAFREKIHNLPKLKSWIDTRPDDAF